MAGTALLGILAGFLPGREDEGGDATRAVAAGASAIATAPEVDQESRPRPNAPDYHILPDQLDDWLAAATPAEDALIADGVLSFEEYESAVLSTLSCAEAAGVKIGSFRAYGRGYEPQDGPKLSIRGEYSYHGTAPGSPEVRPVAAIEALNRCKAGSAQIEFMWAQHVAPSELEFQAMRDHMAQCLRLLGATVPERPSDADLAAVRSQGVAHTQYRQCQFEAADTFEIDRLPG